VEEIPEVIIDAEAAVAISELLVEGLIEFKDDEDFRLTDKGIDVAWKAWKAMAPRDRLLHRMLVDYIDQINEEIEKEERG
jgi:Mn-dependent DtxR family transcriptional regulator